MTTERAKGEQTLLSDEEIQERMRKDPAVQARVQEVLAEMRNGEPEGPGITAEELPGFLREHRR